MLKGVCGEFLGVGKKVLRSCKRGFLVIKGDL